MAAPRWTKGGGQQSAFIESFAAPKPLVLQGDAEKRNGIQPQKMFDRDFAADLPVRICMQSRRQAKIVFSDFDRFMSRFAGRASKLYAFDLRAVLRAFGPRGCRKPTKCGSERCESTPASRSRGARSAFCSANLEKWNQLVDAKQAETRAKEHR